MSKMTDMERARACAAECEAAYERERKAEEALRADVRWRIETILKTFGAKVKIGGCGCCGSPWLEAEFTDGTKADLEHFSIDTFDDVSDKAR